LRGVALEPSFGVVPDLGYLDHVGGGSTSTDLNVLGPMARSAHDLDLLVSVLAGPDPDDAVAWRVQLPQSTTTSLTRVRVATWFDDEACPIDSEYRAMLRGTADALADAGACVEDAHPDIAFDEQMEVYTHLVAAAVSPSMPDAVAEQISGSHLAWLRWDDHRAALRRRWAEWFEGYDVLLAPAWSIPPFEHDQTAGMTERVLRVNGALRSAFEISHWLMIVNATNQPSVAAPIGRTAAGLPVGMQIVAPYLEDRRAIRVAELTSDVVGGYEVPPGFE
jgi:amidase